MIRLYCFFAGCILLGMDTDLNSKIIIILSVEVAVCVLGAVGNISSFAVLLRHRDEVAASRILLGLTAADTGVLLSLICNASLGILYISGIPVSDEYYTRGAYEYFYICSIYMTVVVSVDRYLVTSRPLMMRRLNHKAIQWRAQIAVAIVSAIMVLPEIISRHVYIEGCTSHMVSQNVTPVEESISLRQTLCHLNSSLTSCAICYSEISKAGQNTEYLFHNNLPCISDPCATATEFRVLESFLSFYYYTGNQKPAMLEQCYHYNITGEREDWNITVRQASPGLLFSSKD